jgi:hypothetical protein
VIISVESEERVLGAREKRIRPCIMGVLREGAYQNKPNVLLSTGAYLYRRGA